jgi:hypothetical protein
MGLRGITPLVLTLSARWRFVVNYLTLLLSKQVTGPVTKLTVTASDTASN